MRTARRFEKLGGGKQGRASPQHRSDPRLPSYGLDGSVQTAANRLDRACRWSRRDDWFFRARNAWLGFTFARCAVKFLIASCLATFEERTTTISPELESRIHRYFHAEKLGEGTNATQLEVQHGAAGVGAGPSLSTRAPGTTAFADRPVNAVR